jgi:hypothetical protein
MPPTGRGGVSRDNVSSGHEKFATHNAVNTQMAILNEGVLQAD